MARRKTTQDLSSQTTGDGSTAGLRQRQAPDPNQIWIDGRSNADFIRFVYQLAEHLGWQKLCEPSEVDGLTKEECAGLNNASIIARILEGAEAEREFSEAQLRWLGRPHYALLLVFIQLMRHYRHLLNGFAGRHLDHYFRERLGFSPRPAQPDHVTVAFELASQATVLVLPAGTLLTAGDDSQGVERQYKTVADLFLNHSRVRELRAVRVVREGTTLESLLAHDFDVSSLLNSMLSLVYGVKGPGDPPSDLMRSGFSSNEMNKEFLDSILPLLQFCRTSMKLELHEFQQMMSLYNRRNDDGARQEWNFINRQLGIADLLIANNENHDERDFEANFYASIYGRYGVPGIDWTKDEISELNGIDDLYLQRDIQTVRDYLDKRLSGPSCLILGNKTPERRRAFYELMQIKIHIDNEWKQINWVLQRIGQRKRSVLTWRLDPSQPVSASTRFGDNLKQALQLDTESSVQNFSFALRSVLSGVNDASQADMTTPEAVATHLDRLLSSLEDGFAMPAGQLLRLASLVKLLEPQNTQSENDPAWKEIINILSAAHLLRLKRRRQAKFAEKRKKISEEPFGPKVFKECVDLALEGLNLKEAAHPNRETWADQQGKLADWLGTGQLEQLNLFYSLLENPGSAPRGISWAEVDAVLEAAQGAIERWQPAQLGRVEWRQLHSHVQQTDAKALEAGIPLAPCFGIQPAVLSKPPEPGPGFGVASRLLGLAEGIRTITLTLTLYASGFPENGSSDSGSDLVKRLKSELLVETSTAEGWLEAPIHNVSVLTSPIQDASVLDSDRHKDLNFILILNESYPALAPLDPGDLPRLRVRLRPWLDKPSGRWRSSSAYEQLRLVAARLKVEVDGLTSLRLQQEAAPLDPLQPFQPFGSSPTVGSSFYISHPELLDGELEVISFKGTWLKLPTDMADHYKLYPDLPGPELKPKRTAASFKLEVSLLTRNKDSKTSAENEKQMFQYPEKINQLEITYNIPSPPSKAWATPLRPQEVNDEDLRLQGRVWRWRLAPIDFGHGLYPALAANKANELALAISKQAAAQAKDLAMELVNAMKQVADAKGSSTPASDDPIIANYSVPEPYTPLLESLSVNYSRSQDLSTAHASDGHMYHIHPFGEQPFSLSSGVNAESAPLLLPNHPNPGELMIGLEGTQPPQPITLAFQLADGSARGERPSPAVIWDVLDGDAWRSLQVREDGTDGLLHSGILSFDLPVVAPGRQLPAGQQWLRASLRGPVEAYATILAIQAQAVEAVFIDQEHGLDHYLQPLPPQSITGLVEANGQIATIRQPFSSSGGRPPEAEQNLRLRVAEQLRHKGRALTGWDYERLLWDRFGSQLHKVMCMPSQQSHRVEVLIIPNLRQQVPLNLFSPGAPSDLLAAMEEHLRQRCPPDIEINVRNPTYMHVRVRLWVCLQDGVDRAYAEHQLQQELIKVLSPWCHDADADVTVGGKAYVVDIAAAIDSLPYVNYLERLNLFLVDEGGIPLRLGGKEQTGDDVFLRGEGNTVDDDIMAPGLQAPAADVVLISYSSHDVEFVSPRSTSIDPRIGIGMLKIGLDFQLA